MLSCAADAVSALGVLPVLLNRLIGCCVHHRCLGSLLTLLLTATVCDVGAVVVFLSSSGGVYGVWQLLRAAAQGEGAPAAMALVGVWDCLLLSSICLELVLCLSAWRLYRCLREARIYPPDVAHARVLQEVSPLEFIFEAEDVALLSEQCDGCRRGTTAPRDDSDPHSPVKTSGEAEWSGGGAPGIGGKQGVVRT